MNAQQIAKTSNASIRMMIRRAEHIMANNPTNSAKYEKAAASLEKYQTAHIIKNDELYYTN